jgi:hypothetical protein
LLAAYIFNSHTQQNEVLPLGEKARREGGNSDAHIEELAQAQTALDQVEETSCEGGLRRMVLPL